MDCAECNEAHEVVQQFVISRGDPTEVFEFIEETLHIIAFLVEFAIIVMWVSSVMARWDDRNCPCFQDSVVKMFRIIGAIAHDIIAAEAFDQWCAIQHFPAMAGRRDDAGGIAKAIGGGMQLGAQPTAGPAKPLGIRPPFFVRAPAAC